MKFLFMLLTLLYSTLSFSQNSSKLDKQIIDKINSYKINTPTIAIGKNGFDTGIETKSFQDAFEAEEVDSEWAFTMKKEFGLIAENNGGVLDIECRTTLCQGSVAFASVSQISITENNTRFMQVFSKMLYSDIGKSGELNLTGTKRSTINNSISFSFSFGRSSDTLQNHHYSFRKE